MDHGLKLGKRGGRFVPVDAGGFGSAALGKRLALEIVGEGAIAALDRQALRRITVEELENQIAAVSLF